MENVFVSNHPLIQHKLALMRSVETEPKKFREVVREITEPLALRGHTGPCDRRDGRRDATRPDKGARASRQDRVRADIARGGGHGGLGAGYDPDRAGVAHRPLQGPPHLAARRILQ